MDGSTANSTVSDHMVWAWEAQGLWSRAADKLKHSLSRARNACLALTIAAAVLATVAAQIEKHWGTEHFGPAGLVAFAAALSMGLVTVLQMATRRARVESWSRARSVSEALKAEIFVFLAGVAPYRDGARDAQFKTNVERILAEVDDITDLTIGLAVNQRPLPAVTGVDSYAVQRVQGQIEAYYRPKSGLMRRRASQYRIVETALAAFAVCLSAAAAWGVPQLAAWTGVLTTVVAATTAHAAVQRYDALALEYAQTYRKLERLLRDRADGPGQAGTADPDADDQFVTAAEGILSTQNQAWMSRNLSALSGGKS